MKDVIASGKVPGPAPLTQQREEHARLIARGVSNSEACQIVKVNRRTGTRWLYGRTVPLPNGTSRDYPAVNDIAKEARPRSIRYLSEEERVVISDRRRTQVSMREIARELGRDVSTVSRELARNVDDSRRYRPSAAQRMATARLARPRVRKVAADPVLAAVVQGWLDTKWSPEQISHSLLTWFPGIRPGSSRPRPSTKPSTRNVPSCNETRATAYGVVSAGAGRTVVPTGAGPTS